MTIHTIGDSHSFKGWPNSKNIITHHLGPILCFSIGSEGLKRLDIRKFDIKKDDTIVFCFGEIDCRYHIHKHLSKENNYQTIIDDIVKKYFKTIDLNIRVSNINLNVSVYNVVPPIQTHNTLENPRFPFLGSDVDRKKYVLYFNKKLKEMCNSNNYIFFDVYYRYTDKNGFLDKTLSDNGVHIQNGKYIQHFIEDHLS